MVTARMGLGVSVLAVLLCWVVVLGGCGGEGAETQAEGKTLPPYPSALSAQSSPTQVAQVLIQALDEGNDQVLLGLVAVKHDVEAIDSIYRKHGKEHETAPADAAALTVSGWKTSYAWYQPGATYVAEETIEGNTAAVWAQGANPTTGRPRELTISMVWEDGVWKVAAGLQAREL
jgi:hypothetical protein